MPDFIDEVRAFAIDIPEKSEKILTEEGTKNALVMPFIRLLGYDVFNPNEVNPEFITDVGIKKGEKVDYAIMKDGHPIILFECKSVNTDLKEEHKSQLLRYFHVSDARVGVLTDGIIYQFYTDLESPNVMDDKPFLEINLLDIKEPLIEELKKFTKESFDVDQLDSNASYLKYTKEIKNILNNEFTRPSDEFIRLLAKQVYSKPITQQVKDKFTAITQEATHQFLNEKINERLKNAMTLNVAVSATTHAPDINSEQMQKEEPEKDIVTTEDEIRAYYIVQAILTEIVDPHRVVMRDAKTYCPIFLDNKNQKTICRLYFNTKQKSVAVFDNEEKEPQKINISDLSEIYGLADHFKRVVLMYDPSLKRI